MLNKFRSILVLITLSSFFMFCGSSLFAELDPELDTLPKIDQTDFFLASYIAAGPNKLTGHSELGIACAVGIEAGMFKYIGLYNVLHVGMEYSIMTTNYSTSEYEDDFFVPVRLMPKIGYGLAFSKKVTTFLDIGIGPTITKIKRELEKTSSSASTDTTLGLAYTLDANVNVKLYKKISLNVGMRGDLINVKPSEFQIDDQDQVNGESITTISYGMHGGVQVNL